MLLWAANTNVAGFNAGKKEELDWNCRFMQVGRFCN